MEEKKKFEVVSGDGSALDISPVYDHLNAGKPKSAQEKPTNIVIPKEKNKTISHKICQSCGMPIQHEEEKGTNIDGSKSEDYCKYCFDHGTFKEELTMDQAIEKSAKFASLAGISKEEGIEQGRRLFPTLKRWKKN